MKITAEHQGRRFTADTAEAISIAISLDFDGRQPNHFGAGRASREPLKLGGFVGRTRKQGSCNVDVVHLTPHCNGTHTETISHIVNEELWVGHAAVEPLMIAALISAPTTLAADCGESYRPPLEKVDRVVTAAAIDQALAPYAEYRPQALLLRTLPNEPTKRSRAYAEGPQPAFLTVEAMQRVVESGVRHLLVDLPSVDRMYDDGLLTNHHLFWNVPEKSHTLGDDSWQDKTITEMIFVADDLEDGIYLLDIQAPAFCSDAAPSRPVIMPARAESID